MKIFPILLFGGLLIARLHALESAELAAVTKQFANPSGDEQYKARAELNRLVAQATLPGKGDPAAVTQLLVAAIQSSSRSSDQPSSTSTRHDSVVGGGSASDSAR